MLKSKLVKGSIKNKMFSLTKPYVFPEKLKRNMIKRLILASFLFLPIQSVMAAQAVVSKLNPSQKIVWYECINLEYKELGFFAKNEVRNPHARCAFDKRGQLTLVYDAITDKEESDYRDYVTGKLLKRWWDVANTFVIYYEGKNKHQSCKFSRASFNYNCRWSENVKGEF